MDKKGGWNHVLPSDLFCRTVPKTSLGKNVFQKVLVMKIFMHGSGHHGFVECFCLIVTVKNGKKCSDMGKKLRIRREGAITFFFWNLGGHLFSRNVLVWKKN